MTTRIDNIIIGPARVFTADPDTDLPDETSVDYGGDWPVADWTPVGLLMAGSGVRLTQGISMKDVRGEGSMFPLKRVPTSRALGFSFSLLEFTPENMQLVFPDSDLTATAATGTQKAFTSLILNTGQDHPPKCVAFEAFRQVGKDPGDKQPVRFRIYEGSIEPGGESAFDQENEAIIPVTVMALHCDANEQVAELQYVTGPAI